MRKTTKMHKVASYNYFGVEETLYQKGQKLYMSIIDHRQHDSKLDGIYDELGVYRVDRAYTEKWANARGITIG